LRTLTLSFTGAFSNGSATRLTGTGYILDDDGDTINVGDTIVREGDAQQNPLNQATYQMILANATAPTAANMVVDYNTLAGGAITSAAADNTGQIVITTSASHGLFTGAAITISGVQGTTNANGNWVVTVLSANTFSLNGSTFNLAYVSGTGNWSGGTAVSPSNYTANTTGTVSIVSGNNSQSFNIPVVFQNTINQLDVHDFDP